MSDLTDIAVRLQVYLEGLKSGEAQEFTKLVRELQDELALELAGDELTDLSPKQLEILLARLSRTNQEVVRNALDALLLRLQDISLYSYTVEAAALKSVVEQITTKAVKSATLWKRVMERPLSSSGELLVPWLKRLTDSEVLAVDSLMRKGYAEGWSNRDITRAMRGTRENRYTDGLTYRLGVQNSTMVRTAIQHVNAVARQELWKENDDIVTGYRWVSVLDRKTSTECRSLDGQTFEFGKGPLPPIHPNCRSTTVAVLDSTFDFLDEGGTRSAEGGPAPADMTYYEWLNNQPADFQDSVLGPTRGELLRNGGLTLAEFVRLQLNTLFHPRTLEEMRKIAPLAFKRAGV